MISKRENKKHAALDMSKVFDKLPPNSYEAECALLGSMILDSKVIGDVIEIIDSYEDMFKAAHRVIYAELVDMFDKAEPVDLVNINERLTRNGQLKNVGGLEAIVDLAESVPSALSACYYAKIVRDHAVRRRMVDALTESLHVAHEQREMPAEEMVDLYML